MSYLTCVKYFSISFRFNNSHINSRLAIFSELSCMIQLSFMAHLINFVPYKFFQSIDIYSTESIVLNFVVAQIFVFLTYAGHLDSCLIFWHVS